MAFSSRLRSTRHVGRAGDNDARTVGVELHVDVHAMGNGGEGLDGLVGEFGDRHGGAFAVAAPGFDPGVLDELVEQSFDVFELRSEDPEVAVRVGRDAVLKTFDRSPHRRKGRAQVVADAGEQQLTGVRSSGPFGRSFVERDDHRVDGSGCAADFVVANNTRTSGEVAGGDPFGDLTEAGDVGREWSGEKGADGQRDPARQDQHDEEQPVVMR